MTLQDMRVVDLGYYTGEEDILALAYEITQAGHLRGDVGKFLSGRVVKDLASELTRYSDLVSDLLAEANNHPDPCELYDNDDDDPLPVSCGWKGAYAGMTKVLNEFLEEGAKK